MVKLLMVRNGGIKYECQLEECDVCKNYLTSKPNVWMTEVLTATHVVFDDSKSNKCQVVVFYHKEDVREKKVTKVGC